MFRIVHKLTTCTNQVRGCFARARPYILDADYQSPKAEIMTLDNGLRVASENWHTNHCSVGLYMDVGVRCENENNNGILKYIEHMLLRGTEKRSGKQIQQEILQRGAEVKTSTSREITSVIVNCLKKDVDWAVELLGEIVSKPKYTPESFDRQRHVVLKDYDKYVADPKTLAMDLFYATGFQGTDFELPLYGNRETIENMNIDDVTAFMHKYFISPKMTLAVAGGVTASELKASAQKHLRGISGISDGEIDIKRFARFTGSEIRDQDDFQPLGHVAYGYQCPEATHPDVLSLELAASIIGRFDVSHHHIYDANLNVNKLGYGENFCNMDNFFIQHGLFSVWGIYYSSTSTGLYEISPEILISIKNLCIELTNVEVNKAINCMIIKTLADTDSMEKMSRGLGHDLILRNERVAPSKRVELINALKSEQIIKAMNKHIYDREPAIGAYGAIEGLEVYTSLKAMTVSAMF